MRVGFAGLGRMGQPMAANIAAAGHHLTVWTRDRDKAGTVAAAIGAERAESPRDLAEGVEVVISMLADDAASEAVHLGEDGVFAASTGARYVILMGTHSPQHVARLVATAGSREVIDAPVSGATQAAADAALLIMAGADDTTLAPVRPVLETMGKAVVALGAAGHGAVMKLAVNALIHGMNQTLAEAINVAENAGIPPETAMDVVEASAAGAPMFAYRRPLYLDDRSHDVTFTVALAEKDMRLFADLARAHGAAVPQSELTCALLAEAAAAGLAEADMAAMVRYMRGKT